MSQRLLYLSQVLSTCDVITDMDAGILCGLVDKASGSGAEGVPGSNPDRTIV